MCLLFVLFSPPLIGLFHVTHPVMQSVMIEATADPVVDKDQEIDKYSLALDQVEPYL